MINTYHGSGQQWRWADSKMGSRDGRRAPSHIPTSLTQGAAVE